MSTTMNA